MLNLGMMTFLVDGVGRNRIGIKRVYTDSFTLPK
jgi:hypothetical protein